ncbi:HflC protein [Treponema denticola MYR-T]|uniref:Protein HflC n=1 Tax=Treponema denticola H1-T TaxID=999431 RepID=M2B0S5_TREDN|nr:protease modulator HflC [Treponema denticola]EMB28499.1 HflC protein [Treponema denticola MYR-T]EMB29241.1 HflC protein [Treponema denticola H1-T]EMB46270.1 HflC protein [Treponema denticola AL-2]
MENYENTENTEDVRFESPSSKNKIKPEKNKKDKKGFGWLFFIIILVVLFFFLKPFYILNEGNVAIITKFGAVVKTEKEAGLHFKMPLIHTVNKYTAKLLRLDGDPQKILTLEKQYLRVDTTSRWRIVDVKKFYESLTTYDSAYSRLSDIVDSSVRDIISVNSLADVVRSSNIINESKNTEEFNLENAEVDLGSLKTEKVNFPVIKKGRETLADEILAKANSQLGEFGLEVVDLIFKGIKYSDELENSVFSRMIKERNQIAGTFRSTGDGEKLKILGELENEKRTILSQAYAEAERIKGDADAKAVAIYAESYGKSPEFYSFWKSMEIYKNSLPETEKVLSTDMEYFQYLYRH